MKNQWELIQTRDNNILYFQLYFSQELTGMRGLRSSFYEHNSTAETGKNT